MIKFRTLKNSCARLKENFIYTITDDDMYIKQLIEEVESVPENERVYYTHEEFWKMVKEKEIERYGHPI